MSLVKVSPGCPPRGTFSHLFCFGGSRLSWFYKSHPSKPSAMSLRTSREDGRRMRSSCTEDRRQSGAPDYSPLSALLTCIRINMKNVNNTTMCFQNRFQSHIGSENT
eukprot:07837_3